MRFSAQDCRKRFEEKSRRVCGDNLVKTLSKNAGRLWLKLWPCRGDE